MIEMDSKQLDDAAQKYFDLATTSFEKIKNDFGVETSHKGSTLILKAKLTQGSGPYLFSALTKLQLDVYELSLQLRLTISNDRDKQIEILDRSLNFIQNEIKVTTNRLKQALIKGECGIGKEKIKVSD